MSTPYEPEHEKLRTDLGAYVLGALPADEVAALEAHLATCAGCRAERDALLPAATVLGELKRDDVAARVPRRGRPCRARGPGAGRRRPRRGPRTAYGVGPQGRAWPPSPVPRLRRCSWSASRSPPTTRPPRSPPRRWSRSTCRSPTPPSPPTPPWSTTPGASR